MTHPYGEQPSNIPIPDPSILTTEQLTRAVTSEREYVNGQLEVLRTRLAGMDKATELLKEGLDLSPQVTQSEINHLRELMQGKVSELSQAIKHGEDAVEVAMISAEKAVAKAEIANEKRFESVDIFRRQLSEQMQTVMSRNEADVRIAGLSEKLDIEAKRSTERTNELELRLTSRLDLMTGNKQGGQETKSGMYALIGAGAGVAAILSVLVATGVIGK